MYLSEYTFQKTKVIYGFVTKIGTFWSQNHLYCTIRECPFRPTESGARGANILQNHVQQIQIFASFICT